jgi:hypothetical protein
MKIGYYLIVYSLAGFLLTNSWHANAQTQCSDEQLQQFKVECTQIGANVAKLETDCVAAYGGHYFCGYYPWPSKIQPIFGGH